MTKVQDSETVSSYKRPMEVRIKWKFSYALVIQYVSVIKYLT